LAIVQTRLARPPGGSTVFPHGDVYLAQGSETGNVSETSLFQPDSRSSTGPIDTWQYREAVLITNCTSIGTGGATLAVKLYACDSLGNRTGAALITKSITATGSTRDAVTAPIGNYIDVTTTITSQTGGTTTCEVELQLKT